MIRVPATTDDGGGEEVYPAAQATCRVEWSSADTGGSLPREEVVARFVTPTGTVSRRIRLRLVDAKVV